jgi:hypothetical protein
MMTRSKSGMRDIKGVCVFVAVSARDTSLHVYVYPQSSSISSISSVPLILEFKQISRDIHHMIAD